MTDITPEPDPREDPQHIPSENKRHKEMSKPKITDAEDARDPSRVPPREVPQNPALKPADEQEAYAREVEKGMEWAEEDKHTVDRRSRPEA